MDSPLSSAPNAVSPAAESSRPKPVQTIQPSQGWSALDLVQVWLFRDLLITLATRDVKLRYRQTALGAVWVILQPLLAAGVLSIVFNRVAKMPTHGVPAILFTYAGMLGYNAFSATLAKTSACLVGNSNLISKVYFPRLVLPLSTVFSSLLDFCVASGMLAVMMLIYGRMPSVGILLLPLWLLIFLMLAVGIGLFASSLMVTYRDVQYVIPVAISLLTFASPTAYALVDALDRVRDVPALRAFYQFNPLTGLLEAFRWSIFGPGVGTLNWLLIAYSALFAVCLFVAGAFFFKKMEKKFADVI